MPDDRTTELSAAATEAALKLAATEGISLEDALSGQVGVFYILRPEQLARSLDAFAAQARAKAIEDVVALLKQLGATSHHRRDLIIRIRTLTK